MLTEIKWSFKILSTLIQKLLYFPVLADRDVAVKAIGLCWCGIKGPIVLNSPMSSLMKNFIRENALGGENVEKATASTSKSRQLLNHLAVNMVP